MTEDLRGDLDEHLKLTEARWGGAAIGLGR